MIYGNPFIYIDIKHNNHNFFQKQGGGVFQNPIQSEAGLADRDKKTNQSDFSENGVLMILIFIKKLLQAWAELCQAQHSLS